MADRNFSRMATIRVPFSASSGGDQFNMLEHGIPVNPDGTIMDDMSFAFVNETLFDVRLEGFPLGKTFTTVKKNTGWSILARVDKGPFLSKKPISISVQAFSTPGNPFAADADFTGCFLELVYGRGR